MLRTETITFTRHAGGAVTADHFPKYTTISRELLGMPLNGDVARVEWLGLGIWILGVLYLVVSADDDVLTLMRVPE